MRKEAQVVSTVGMDFSIVDDVDTVYSVLLNVKLMSNYSKSTTKHTRSAQRSTPSRPNDPNTKHAMIANEIRLNMYDMNTDN